MRSLLENYLNTHDILVLYQKKECRMSNEKNV